MPEYFAGKEPNASFTIQISIFYPELSRNSHASDSGRMYPGTMVIYANR